MSTVYFEDDVSTISVGDSQVDLSGEIDIRTLASLRRALIDATESANGTVSVDLSGVSFIDSASIGLLITAKRRAELADQRLTIVDCSPIVRRVFEIMGLVTVFGIDADPSE